MKLSKEDIQKFATEDEKKILKEDDIPIRSTPIDRQGLNRLQALQQDITKAKKKIIAHHKRYGAHEMGVSNWADKLIGALEDKWKMNDLVYSGHNIERKMAELLKDFWTWAVNYEGQEDLPGPNSLRKESKQLMEKWTARLQKVYSSFDEFESYDAMYNLAKRLGYNTPIAAWDANPLISGGVNPEEYHKVKESKELSERRRGYIPLYIKQKKIIDRFIEEHYHDIKRGSLWFNVDDWPELYDEVAAVRETETLYQDINRYVSDKLSEMPWKNRYPWGDDIDKFATDNEKEFLKEWVGEKHMDFEAYKKKLKSMTYSELEFARKDAYETAKIHDQMEKEGVPNNAGYYWDEVHMIAQEMKKRPFAKDSFLPWEESIEKKSLKESVADQRAMNFIKASNGDVEEWKKMIAKMSPREIKDATFEFQSARDGVTWYIQKWTIPSKHREEKKERRKLYQRYLNRLRKVKKEMELKKPDFSKKDPLGFGKAINSDRIKNMSDEEAEMILKMFK
jgi:hypothetical protein